MGSRTEYARADRCELTGRLLADRLSTIGRLVVHFTSQHHEAVLTKVI